MSLMQPGLSPYPFAGQGIGQGIGGFSMQPFGGQQPLNQLLQTLQFLPHQLQQLQQIQLLQHQQVQQLLQIVPAQLQQLHQVIQFIAQQIPSLQSQQFGQSPWASLQAGGYNVPFQSFGTQFAQPGQVM